MVNDFSGNGFLPDDHYDLVTLIEVIEHLTAEDIRELIGFARRKLKAGGKLVITTPNFASFWPALEMMLNRFSDVKYQEQHITRFSYFNVKTKLGGIVDGFHDHFRIGYKTTTHLLTPFVAAFSFTLASQISSAVSPDKWKIPLGSILIIQLIKNQ
ncbi:MAG: class I SAM-dependent methyltransferase [Bacteroidales bacterium]